MTNHKLAWVQVLRGAAAIFVLLFHARPYLEKTEVLASVSPLFNYGFAGVDIFFVLSGFVVYKSALRAVCAREFIWNRLARVYAGYWPVFLICVILPLSYKGLGGTDPMLLLRSFLLLTPNLMESLVPTAWSLTFELWFYVWVAVGLRFFASSLRYYAALLLFLTLWNFYFLMFDRENVFNGGQPLRYLFAGLGIEFLMGVFIAAAHNELRKFKLNYPVLMAVFFCIGLATYTAGTINFIFDRIEFIRFATFGIFGACVVIFFLSMDAQKIKAPAVLVTLGDASYALYLLHPFLLHLGGKLYFKLQLSGVAAALYVIAMLLVILAISVLWYRMLEKPLTRFVTKLGHAPRGMAECKA